MQLDTWEILTIIGVIAGVIGVPLAIFGAYVGIRQIIQWRKDAKTSRELKDRLEDLSKKVNGISWYIISSRKRTAKRR